MLAAFLQAGQDAGQETIEAGMEAGAERHEVGLVHRQQGRANRQGGVGKQREQPGRVDEELRGKPVGSHALHMASHYIKHQSKKIFMGKSHLREASRF